MFDDQDLLDVVDRERRLHDRVVRGSPALAGEILDQEFREFGASGRVWDRAAILEMMAGETDAPAPVADRFVATRLAPDVVHLTYRVRRPELVTLRSSLWRRCDGSVWRLYFHQATVQPPTGNEGS